MTDISAPSGSAPFFDGLNRLSPQAVFVLIAGFFGIIIALVTPPMQGPDEPHHWYRVYQLSQGKMLSTNYGGDIPTSMTPYQYEQGYLDNGFAAIPTNGMAKVHLQQLADEYKKPLLPRKTRFEPFPNTALYSIVPYAPQTLTTFIFRKMNCPPLALLYVGRLGTILGYLLIGWAAIRITPILKWPACMILCCPMSLFMAASVSADPITTVITFLATAIALRCIMSSTALGNGMIFALLIAMLAIALCKSAYFPVAFLVLAIGRDKWGNGHRRWILPLGIILLSIATVAGWSFLTKAGNVKERGESPSLQLQWILHNPLQYMQVLRLTAIAYWNIILNSSVGILGWLDTPLLPSVIDFIFIALLWITLAYDEPISLNAWPRFIAFIALVVSIGLIATANYMVWNPVGFRLIEGLQGRYFLPIAMMMCLVVRRRGSYTVQPKWMLAMLSALSIYTIWVLVERYYLPNGIFWHVTTGT